MLRSLILGGIEEQGRRRGAPTVKFPDKKISIDGEDIHVSYGCFLWWLLQISGFYLPLPSNVYGVVVYPDGTSHNMEGGIHEALPGFYKVEYVDKRERLDYTSPVSEMTSDGEKLTLKVIVRYRVIDPITALSINRPVEVLIENIEADLAQYIRTHKHNDIANSESHEDNKILSFFSLRHNRRPPISKAFTILGIELKEFTGDQAFVEMRHDKLVDEQKSINEKMRMNHENELDKIKKQHKEDMEKKAAEHEREREKILHEVDLLKSELAREQWDREDLAKALDALTQIYSSGRILTASEIKVVTDLIAELRKKETEEKSSSQHTEAKPGGDSRHFGNDKIGKLTDTLLDLLKPKK